MPKKDNNTETIEEPQEEQKPKETTVEFLSSLAAVLVTGLFIITFVMQAFEIPSSSMENTLLIGDHVFVNRVQFAPKSSWVGHLLPYRDVRRGDDVLFAHTAIERDLLLPLLVNGIFRARENDIRLETNGI